MFMQHNRTRRSKRNENDVQNSAILNKGNKEFGPSSAKNLAEHSNRTNENLALKIKSSNQKVSLNKNINEKSKLKENSNIPLKRSKSTINSIHQPEAKKQNIQGIERTYRHHEEELEWAPAGLDMDFSPFDSKINESSYFAKEHMLQDDYEEDIEQAFETEEPTNFIKPIETTVQEIKKEEEEDMSRVEYGPPREEELPYLPDESCIIDVSNFDPYVDLSAYELMRLFNQDLEFTLYEDQDVLDQIAIACIDDDNLG
ncbi:uncharacterized protein BX663DRAFT_501236 [Cokeromyces recurvatus]|uniref:uncharacterized protein n=1 Tax=Cokeromyces recurvatus TaxID=90255 RepID=UPI00221EFAB4|nr:uncharacterized protein BX663DRAFT_501236 [Cokeromyces recurvatus]KAI7904974.1 hypothetical protein BX663DRAFT_501236 [Cokeromyces recurvatus]